MTATEHPTGAGFHLAFSAAVGMGVPVLRPALILLMAFVMLMPTARAEAAPVVAGAVRVAAIADGVQVRLALSAPLAVPPQTFALGDPDRLVVDLTDASAEQRDTAGSGEVKGIRLSQFDPTTVRLVIDLHRPMRIVAVSQGLDNVLEVRLASTTVEAFAADRKLGRRPVAGFVAEARRVVPPGPEPAKDVLAESDRKLAEIERVLAEAERQASAPTASTSAASAASTQAPGAAAVAEAAPVVSARPQPKGGRDRFLVVLDAGHGGKDPGATSVNGGQEKQVTLAIALAAKRAIERQARARGQKVEVKLTRDDDRFVTLGGRVRLARQWGADLFLSIHADSAANAMAQGATVYTLSDVASDREAARLAAKENRADLIAGVDLTGEDREVAGLLVTLGMRDSMNASADFAESLQRAMARQDVPFRSNYHRFAGFQVLRNLGIPAVLLETGYMSNEADSKRLFSAKGQRDVANGIADAVLSWVGGR